MASVACAHQPTLAASQCMKIQAVATGKTYRKNVFFPVCMYVYIAGCPLHTHSDEIEAQTRHTRQLDYLYNVHNRRSH